MSRHVVLFRTAIVILCLILSGCGGESYTYVPDHELKPGPGVFSGKDGEFNIVGLSAGDETEQNNKEEQQKKETGAPDE